MGSTGEQPTSELVAGLLDTARASRTRTMQEVAGAWQRAGTITRNLILMASSETGSIERPATDLVTQLHMYILVAGPEAATSRSQPPSSLGDGTPRALGGWLTEVGHNEFSALNGVRWAANPDLLHGLSLSCRVLAGSSS
jgi:hypothetical protein